MKFRTNLTTVLALAVFMFMSGCALTIGSKDKAPPVYLPYIKNSPNECYYLDELMPVPDGMVRGKNGPLELRYYSYKSANYKDWEQSHVILSFYSQDKRCWSLFEEYYVVD